MEEALNLSLDRLLDDDVYINMQFNYNIIIHKPILLNSSSIILKFTLTACRLNFGTAPHKRLNVPLPRQAQFFYTITRFCNTS